MTGGLDHDRGLESCSRAACGVKVSCAPMARALSNFRRVDRRRRRDVVVRQRGEHRGHADTAQPDDDDGLPRLGRSDVEHGAASGEHGAAQQ